MKKHLFYINRKYFQQIMAGLIAFILLLYMPFSFLLLHIAKKNILNNITVSNQTILDQLESNYQNYSANIRTLTSSIFWRNDVQYLLYTRQISYEDVYRTMSDLSSTVIANHPDLHSICIYNKFSDELYVTCAEGFLDKKDFSDFVKSRENLSVLRPVLHNVISNAANQYTTEMTAPVFSYFMYQFNNPAESKESYLVLNQFAGQSIRTIDTFTGSGNSIPTATYYVTKDMSISSKTLDQEFQQDHDILLERFRNDHDSLDKNGGSYEANVNGSKYLLTYALAEPEESAVLIIQDYDVVFADLNTLQRDFLIVLGVLLLSSVILALLVSRRLYQPIDQVFDTFLPASSTPDNIGRRFNELDFMKQLYETTSKQKELLESKENRYQPIAEEYNLRSMLLKSDMVSIERFRQTQPGHWLTQTDDALLQILLLRPSHQEQPVIEMPLLLYTIQNIAEELLSPGFYCAFFRYTNDTLGVVLTRREECSQDELLSNLKQMHDFMAQHFHVPLSVSGSEQQADLFNLTALLQQASLGLSYAYLFDATVITPDMYASNENNDQISYSAELDTVLADAIAKQNLTQCKNVLAEIKADLRTFSANNAVFCTIALLNQVNRILSKQSPLSANSAASEFFRTLYNRVSEGDSIDQCFEDIFNYISSRLTDQIYEDKTSDQFFLETVYEFVQNSYNDFTLSSQLIADYLGLNNRYLMKKFKTLSGVTLAEYITDFRIKKAAFLLENTQEAVSTISEQVGIENVSYFYRLFKKSMNCTPKEYREQKQGAGTP